MYLVCTLKQDNNFDAVRALNHGITVGTLNGPPQVWQVHLTCSSRDLAVRFAKQMANENGIEVEVRSGWSNGDHYSIASFSPPPIEEQEKYDGVPADTGSV